MGRSAVSGMIAVPFAATFVVALATVIPVPVAIVRVAPPEQTGTFVTGFLRLALAGIAGCRPAATTGDHGLVRSKTCAIGK